jgi:urease subunit gamma/beta
MAYRTSCHRHAELGSHFHSFEGSRERRFNRSAAPGMRMDIPSETAVRFERVEAQAFSWPVGRGEEIVFGQKNLTSGPTSTEQSERALDRHEHKGFPDTEAWDDPSD